MNEQIFPPSPNWYLSSVFACNSNGVLAFGNRNNLVIITTFYPEKCLPKVEVIPGAHKERLTVVLFSPPSNDSSLKFNIATSGDDGVVKVWDLQTRTPILAHVSHGMNTKVTSMDWSRANPDLIVSVDDNNNIVSWDLPSNSTRTYNLGKLCASVLSCCPFNKDLLALGCRSGLVCVASLQGRGKILFRMRGHDSEIVSLAWCPVGYNIFESFETKNEKIIENNDFILASAAKEKTIFLWRANSDGRYELTLTIPTHLMANQRSNKGGTNDMNWVSLCWPQANTLICSTRLGRVIAWDLKASYIKRPKKVGINDSSSVRTWRLVHSLHSRVIFNIITSQVTLEMDSKAENKWRHSPTDTVPTENPLIIWSNSQDRLIIGYDLNSNKEIASIPTIGGIVYCIAASPIDPNRIAFGVSDAVIRIWNLSSVSPFDVTLLWQKIRGKVTSIAWHPTQESNLAFGTSQGRIGIFDTLNSNKPPMLLRPYHTKSLYAVVWGPTLFGSGDGDGPSGTKYTLYSCGEGDAVQYDIHNSEAVAKNLNELPQLNAASKKSLIRTDLVWKPDNSVLALGNEDGSVQLVTSSKATVLHTIYAHKNLVQSMAWHPEGTATDSGYSPCQHWLAIASKKSPIKVYNVAPLLEGDGSGDVECLAVFSQHKVCVVGMCWSPHVSGLLLSVSFDETAQIWDVPQQQPIGNYSHHAGVLHCGCWSPFDPDLVITGAADSTLRVWRISTLDRTVPLDKKKEKNAAKKVAALQYSVENCTVSPEKETKLEEVISKVDVIAGCSPMPNKGIASEENDVQSSKSARQRARSYFPVWAQMWQGSTNNILDRFQMYLCPEGVCDTEPNLLGSRQNVQELLKLEELQHLQNSNTETIQQMALWKGDVGEMIRDSAKKKKLTDWLVSLAPMVSQRLWLDTCRMYADQLTLEGRIHKAASYLLASHKVEEAIQLFMQHNLFREALTVAKLRLNPEDPLIFNIVTKWSQQQILDGHYERAAECLASIADLTGAAEILGKRNDARCLWLAADIAYKNNSQSVALCYAKNCLTQCLLHKNWDLAWKVTNQYTELQYWMVLIFTFNVVTELLSEKIYIEEPLHLFINKQFKVEHGKDTKEFYKDLERNITQSVPDSKNKLWLNVSEDIALSCSAANELIAMRHLVHAANVCYQYQLMHPNIFPLLQYLHWLAPKGILDESNIFHLETLDEDLMLLRRSLRFYMYAAFFSWLQTELVTLGYISICDKNITEDGSENDSANANVEGNNFLSSENSDNGKDNKPRVDEKIEEKSNCETEIVERLENLELTKTNKYESSGCVSVPKLNWQELLVPILTRYANEIPSESPALVYYKQKVEIKKWEQEVAGLVALQHQTTGGKCMVSEKEEEEEKEETKMIQGLQILSELKELKELFERQRGSSPNPFVTYCHFTSVCDFLIKEKNIQILKKVSETAAKHWLRVSADLK